MAANSATYNQEPRRPWGLLFLGLGILLLIAWAFLSMLSKPLGGGLQTLAPPLVRMSVSAAGDVEVPLPTDSGTGMPDCKDLGVPDCKWDAKLRQEPSGEGRVIETTLKQDGKVIGKAQVMEVETAEFEELKVLHDMGHKKAWISHIKIKGSLRGNGLGRSLWNASDAMIKTLVGPGQAVHIFVDQAGWGNALMREIAESDIVIAAADWWAYIVR